jgi:hypothetical protein
MMVDREKGGDTNNNGSALRFFNYLRTIFLLPVNIFF